MEETFVSFLHQLLCVWLGKKIYWKWFNLLYLKIEQKSTNSIQWKLGIAVFGRLWKLWESLICYFQICKFVMWLYLVTLASTIIIMQCAGCLTAGILLKYWKPILSYASEVSGTFSVTLTFKFHTFYIDSCFVTRERITNIGHVMWTCIYKMLQYIAFSKLCVFWL